MPSMSKELAMFITLCVTEYTDGTKRVTKVKKRNLKIYENLFSVSPR